MMINENTILELVNSHKNSIVNVIGNDDQSLYMQGYINACNNITGILYTYFKSIERKGV